jgi:hypothetical protein
MGVQLMKYTDLMAKIDEKFKERDGKLEILKQAYHRQNDKLYLLEKLLEDIKNQLIEMKNIIDEDDGDEDEECEKGCIQCDQETIESIITNFHADLRKALTKD